MAISASAEGIVKGVTGEEKGQTADKDRGRAFATAPTPHSVLL